MSSNNTLEIYILSLIKKREDELKTLISNKETTYKFSGVDCKMYTDKDYWNIFARLSGQISDLYMCLTAHDNKYDNELKTK